jgi:flavin reductase (DIM6/NTAB) family NADH-FMN oxidoreductase RutF
MLSIGPRADGSEKDTLRNLRERGELAIQLVSVAQAASMNETSASFPHGVSEFERCGVSALHSERIAPLRVAGAQVVFECRLAQIQPYPATRPSHHLVFAEVLLAHIDDAALTDARHVDPEKLDLVGRLGGTGYATTRDRIHLRRPA